MLQATQFFRYDGLMLIGMPEAARRAGYTRGNSVQRALKEAGVNLVVINARAVAVEESDLEAFLKERGEQVKRGRPARKAKDS